MATQAQRTTAWRAGPEQDAYLQGVKSGLTRVRVEGGARSQSLGWLRSHLLFELEMGKTAAPPGSVPLAWFDWQVTWLEVETEGPFVWWWGSLLDLSTGYLMLGSVRRGLGVPYLDLWGALKQLVPVLADQPLEFFQGVIEQDRLNSATLPLGQTESIKRFWGLVLSLAAGLPQDRESLLASLLREEGDIDPDRDWPDPPFGLVEWCRSQWAWSTGLAVKVPGVLTRWSWGEATLFGQLLQEHGLMQQMVSTSSWGEIDSGWGMSLAATTRVRDAGGEKLKAAYLWDLLRDRCGLQLATLLFNDASSRIPAYLDRLGVLDLLGWDQGKLPAVWRRQDGSKLWGSGGAGVLAHGSAVSEAFAEASDWIGG